MDSYSAGPRSYSHSHSHSRATKASDIAHLLDPSYSPTRTSFPTAEIYVDHAGHAHDPDYRLFAVRPSPRLRPSAAAAYDDDDEEDTDVIDEGVSLYSRRASLDSYAPRPPAPAAYEYSYDYYTYATTSSPEFALDDDAEFDFEGEQQQPRRENNKLRRRSRSSSPPPAPAPNACTATRKQLIRRQWHALCLRTQLAAFRARKRVGHVVSKAG